MPFEETDTAAVLSLLKTLRKQLVHLSNDKEQPLYASTQLMIDALEKRAAADAASPSLPDELAAAVDRSVFKGWCYLASDPRVEQIDLGNLFAVLSFKTPPSALSVAASYKVHAANCNDPTIDHESIKWLTSVAVAIRGTAAAIPNFYRSVVTAARVGVTEDHVGDAPDSVEIEASFYTR